MQIGSPVIAEMNKFIFLGKPTIYYNTPKFADSILILSLCQNSLPVPYANASTRIRTAF